jgi:hypothetical protein
MAVIFERRADAVDQYVARLGTRDGQRGAIFSVKRRARPESSVRPRGGVPPVDAQSGSRLPID